ncbi:class I SAM-dependent methyltransferase [Nonomuraea dietziae]|uniref:class I SAM-dependent methyltransferase n=1 Tax=Nonomuraea dietziae TaxID=65515 RepID=UPI0033F1B953
MIRPWMLDESAHAGPEHLDPAFVAGYDRKQGRPDPREDLEILAAHGVATVVDLAAGTGQFALAAALRFDRVTAVDISPAMLDHVRARAAEQGLANLEVVGGGLLTWEYAGPPVDAVFTRHALHQVPDFFKAIALARIAKMLRPGGILRLRDLIYDFGPDEAEEIFEGWMRDASADPRSATPPTTTPSTSARSTARSDGCWSRCSRRRGSRSSTRPTIGGSTGPTPAAGGRERGRSPTARRGGQVCR